MSPARYGIALIALVITTFTHAAPIDGFAPSGFLNEQQKTWTTNDDVRVLVNAPGDFTSDRATNLIVFALPNGNTIEWTLGAQLQPGMDWHYDIQHVAAQVRKLRQCVKDRNLVLACVEADTKSWPAWRKARPDNARRIRDLVAELSRGPGPDQRKTLTLAAHSGGGSFIFGYINGGNAIPAHVERIALLDANYGYDDETDRHGEKLLAWLKGAPRHTLVVIAYDDRDVKLNGKNVVSPRGGTYRATHRMIDGMKGEAQLVESTRGEFASFSGMGGQVRLLIHANPQRKILHTVLVERNGLIEALTLDSPLEGKWGGEFWGERAYADLIAPAAGANPQAATAPAGIPPRPANAVGGRAFAEQIADLPPKAREAAIYQEVVGGNVPDFLRAFRTITVAFASPDGTKHDATYEVMVDYLAVGSDDDFLRIPMTPTTATRIAEAFGCRLPTRKIVNDVYASADVKLEPRPMGPPRETVETFAKHNAMIEEQRARQPLGKLVAGQKKDVVISNRLKEKPSKVVIYGWHKPDGKPIQPLYAGHADSYVDYSHGIRLVRREMTIDGKKMDVEDVLKDPKLCASISDEGVIDARYP